MRWITQASSPDCPRNCQWLESIALPSSCLHVLDLLALLVFPFLCLTSLSCCTLDVLVHVYDTSSCVLTVISRLYNVCLPYFALASSFRCPATETAHPDRVYGFG